MVNWLFVSTHFVLRCLEENGPHPLFVPNSSFLLYGAGAIEEVGLEVF